MKCGKIFFCWLIKGFFLGLLLLCIWLLLTWQWDSALDNEDSSYRGHRYLGLGIWALIVGIYTVFLKRPDWSLCQPLTRNKFMGFLIEHIAFLSYLYVNLSVELRFRSPSMWHHIALQMGINVSGITSFSEPVLTIYHIAQYYNSEDCSWHVNFKSYDMCMIYTVFIQIPALLSSNNWLSLHEYICYTLLLCSQGR